jgi:hypothetical protein
MVGDRYTEEECLEALATAVDHYGEGPTQEEYDALGIRPSASLISERVGTWKLALAKVGAEKSPRRETTKARCLNAIRNLADDIGGEPTISEYKESGYSPSTSAIYTHCGSWEEAKKEAGVVGEEDRSPSEEADEFFDQLGEVQTPGE